MIDFLVIGGGVAGLSAAIRLTELGAQPLVIESGTYPSHKVCGEFFAPDCVEILQRWGIETIPIPSVNFHSGQKCFQFPFPKPAGSLSHLVCDLKLAERAKRGGATIKTETKVDQFDFSKCQVTLSTGETIQARHLIVSTGRHTKSLPRMRYMGIKAHFKGFSNTNSLEMFSFPGAYLGIAPIEEGKFNVACIAEISRVKNLETFMAQLLPSGERLFPWMTVSIPGFGCKELPPWQNCYFVGDAAGTIPPATGHGLSMALSGGILAAEYALKGDEEGFRRAWRLHYASQIRWGKLFHQVMLYPRLLNHCIDLSKFFVSFPSFIYSHFNFVSA